MLVWEIATVARARCAKLAEMELQADQEHVQDDAELGDDAQDGARPTGEDLRRPLRADQRRSEQDAGQHLANHGRLPDARQQPRQQLPDDDRRR